MSIIWTIIIGFWPASLRRLRPGDRAVGFIMTTFRHVGRSRHLISEGTRLV